MYSPTMFPQIMAFLRNFKKDVTNSKTSLILNIKRPVSFQRDKTEELSDTSDAVTFTRGDKSIWSPEH